MMVDAIDGLTQDAMGECISAGLHPEMWDIQKLRERVQTMFGISWDDLSDDDVRDMASIEISQLIKEYALVAYENKEQELGDEAARQIERMLILQHTDQFWKDHLLAMDRLREGIGLRGYGQRNPLLEYKKEGTSMYMLMTSLRDEAVVSQMLRMEIAPEEDVPEVSKTAAKKLVQTGTFAQPEPQQEAPAPAPAPAAVKRPAPGAEARKVAQELGLGRNDPCPCGSGKKFKKCCGRAGAAEASPT